MMTPRAGADTGAASGEPEIHDDVAEVAIAREAVDVALTHYAFTAPLRLDFIKFRENSVYRLTAGDGREYAVRVHRFGYRTDAEVESELGYLRLLTGRGHVVPSVVPTADGNPMCPARTAAGYRRQVVVQEWIVGGRQMGDVEAAMAGASELSPEDFRALGRLCGQLHASSVAIGTPEGFCRPAWDEAGLTGPNPLWGDPCGLADLRDDEAGLIRRALDAVGEELSRFGYGPDRYGVIHADLTPENVLVTAAGLAVIDFDDFGHGWHLFDIATSLFFYLADPRFDRILEGFIAGYRQVRPLPDAHLNLLRAFLLARGSTYLGWSAQRPGNEASGLIAETVVPLVVALAADYLAEPRPATGVERLLELTRRAGSPA